MSIISISMTNLAALRGFLHCNLMTCCGLDDQFPGPAHVVQTGYESGDIVVPSGGR